MIDYDKLKEAMELAKKLPELYCVSIEVGANGVMFSIDILDGDPESCLHYDVNLDDLITKIRELTKPETKPRYAVGAVVWVNHHEANSDTYIGLSYHEARVVPSQACDMNLGEVYVRTASQDAVQITKGSEYACPESNIYPTRQALIDSQIAYWQGLSEPKSSCCSVHAGTSEECNDWKNVYYNAPEECEHEPGSDRWVNPSNCAWLLDSDKHPSSLTRFSRCKKCGLSMNKFANE